MMNSTNIDIKASKDETSLHDRSERSIAVTIMDALCESVSSLSVSTDPYSAKDEHSDPIAIALKHDAMKLLRAYDCCLGHQGVHVYLMPTLLANGGEILKYRFLSAFPNEADYYKEIVKRVLYQIPSSVLLEIMPLIDEYIEHVFAFIS